MKDSKPPLCGGIDCCKNETCDRCGGNIEPLYQSNFPQWLCKCGVFYKTEIARDLCMDRGHTPLVRASVIIHKAMLQDAVRNIDVSNYGIPKPKVGRKKNEKNICRSCGNYTHCLTSLGHPSKYCINCKKYRLGRIQMNLKVRETKARENKSRQ